VTTYKILAKRLGNKNLARAVGNALNKNPQLFRVPCHRVVKSNGRVGEYKLGFNRKIDILKKEGVIIYGKRILNIKKYLYYFK